MGWLGGLNNLIYYVKCLEQSRAYNTKCEPFYFGGGLRHGHVGS